MPKIKDETVVNYLVESCELSNEEAWFAAQKMLQTDKEEAPDKAERRPTEWIVVVADPKGNLPTDLVGFVVNKKEMNRDENLASSDQPRMWGDEEANAILKHAFARTHDKVKGIPTFFNCLRAAKKLLKDEYGFEIKSKEGCYINPVDFSPVYNEPEGILTNMKKSLEKKGVKVTSIKLTAGDEDTIL